jgi:Mn-dependent DtxR family transcriptional regulator
MQLTDGYYLHFNQFSRMLQYALENLIKPRILSAEYEDALGQSPRNMESLRKIMVELGLLKSNKLTLTEFGEAVAKKDLFFENHNTLWICHYNISSSIENYVWYRFTNKILTNINNYSFEDFYKYYEDVTEYNQGKSAFKSMHKEVKAVLNAYTEQQFKYLRLIYKDYENKFQRDNQIETDPLVYLYCLLSYKENKNINATALTLNEIINDDETPSKVFHLEEPIINDILNRLHSKQLIGLEKFGDLNQARFPNHLTKELVLKEIYGVTQ